MKTAIVSAYVLLTATIAGAQCYNKTPAYTMAHWAQVKFEAPEGMYVQWDVTKPGQYDSVPLVAPGRQSFGMGYVYALKFTRLPGRYGVELFGTLEVLSPDWRSLAYLGHNAITVEITQEEIDQVTAGKLVSKVIYLPKGSVAGPPAAGREAVLAVLRLGDRLPKTRE